MTSLIGSINKPRPGSDPATGADPSTRPALRRPGSPGGSVWRVPVALVVLSIIPVVAGSLRLLEVAGGPQLLPANPRIDAVPAPVVVHIVAAALYALLGAVGSGWVINATVAEWVVRRPAARRARRARTRTALAGSQ